MSARSAAVLGPDPEAAPGGNVSANASGRNAVLLVEDNDTVAGLVTHILVRRQRRVLRARDGAECVRVFTEQVSSIALVILDYQLPDTDGMALCRELRRRWPDVPVLLTSGKDRSRDVDLEACGATAFLPKPFRPAEVEQKVAALLGAIA